MKKTGKFLFTILFIPLTYSTAKSFVTVISHLTSNLTSTIYFLLGMVSFPLFSYFVFKPVRMYVLGHELSHAVVSLLFGGKASKLRVSRKGGSINVTKTNFIVALAPYFFPFYTFLLLLLWFLWHRFATVSLYDYYPVFIYFVGLSLGFHFVLTWQMVLIDQPDIKKTGRVFSFLFIFIANCIVLTLLLKPLFPQQINLPRFFREIFADQYLIWHWIYLKLKFWISGWLTQLD